MDRRTFLATIAGGLLAAPLAAEAQQAGKAARVGVLFFGTPEPFGERFRQALLEHGYIEGQNLVVEYRWASGRTDRLAGLAAELVRQDVDVIVAYATPSIQAAMGATRTIPIVMATAGDALRTGLVSNLARPGGNVTGLSLALIELAGKTVELLREALPRVTRIACVVHTEDPLHRGFLSEAEVAAGRLGLHFRPVLLGSVGEMDAAFGSIVREGVGAAVVQPIFTVDPHDRATLVRLTLKHRLPAVSGPRSFAEAGSGPSPLARRLLRDAEQIRSVFRGSTRATSRGVAIVSITYRSINNAKVAGSNPARSTNCERVDSRRPPSRSSPRCRVSFAKSRRSMCRALGRERRWHASRSRGAAGRRHHAIRAQAKNAGCSRPLVCHAL